MRCDEMKIYSLLLYAIHLPCTARQRLYFVHWTSTYYMQSAATHKVASAIACFCFSCCCCCCIRIHNETNKKYEQDVCFFSCSMCTFLNGKLKLTGWHCKRKKEQILPPRPSGQNLSNRFDQQCIRSSLMENLLFSIHSVLARPDSFCFFLPVTCNHKNVKISLPLKRVHFVPKLSAKLLR